MALELLLDPTVALKMATVAFLTLVTFWLLPALIRWYKMFRFFQDIPGVKDFSIIYGNLHVLPRTGEDRLSFGRKNMERNPKMARFWQGAFKPVITLFHPETAKLFYKSTAPKSRGFGQVYEHAVPWIGEGLISTNGERWARSRRLLTPAFHFDILKPYMEVYNTAADTLFERLDKYAESEESFDICPLMTLCTLEVILKCAMSYDIDLQRQGHHPYATAAKELTELWSERARTVWMWPTFIFKMTEKGRRFFRHCDYVHKISQEVIEARRKSMEKDGCEKRRYLDFLDILLTARDEDGKPMTTEEIRNEVDTFMFAGHDTTATGVPWILYAMAQHEDYQEKVQAELDFLLRERESEHITASDLPQLPTLALCIKEAMRLYPPVPFIQRTLNVDMEIEGRMIPKGTALTLPIIHLHRNPTVWEDPDTFKPERFKPENMKDKGSFAFTPFSAGSRNCIGQNFALNEEKVIIARILYRYNLKVAPDGPPALRKPGAVLRTENGLWFKISRR